MSGWRTHKGTAVSLPVDNIDTDQLIPARFMSRARADGYGDLLLYDFRRTASGEEDTHFVLNRYPTASILVAGRNFGSGSSREAAVYALVDAGIKAVLATSFGDIFMANAINNGLLPACMAEADHARLVAEMGDSEVSACVDLSTQRIRIGVRTLSFQLTDAWRTKLINGWDDVDLTLNYATQIAAYRENRWREQRWSIPTEHAP